MSIDRRVGIVLLLNLSIMLTACGKVEGHFGYKTFMMKSYKNFSSGEEFPTDNSVKWVFVPDKVTSPIEIGIVILQKRAVWIDIESRSVTLNPEASVIHGELPDKGEGDYRILLVKDKKIIAEVSYHLYQPTMSD